MRGHTPGCGVQWWTVLAVAAAQAPGCTGQYWQRRPVAAYYSRHAPPHGSMPVCGGVWGTAMHVTTERTPRKTTHGWSQRTGIDGRAWSVDCSGCSSMS